MPAREEGRRAALVITQQLDLAKELTEAIEAVGLCARVVSALDHLDAHADTRPSIVITDLALQPNEGQWETLAQLFPRSVLWAVCGQNMTEVAAVTAAFKHGCRDCLSRPITHEDFSERLAALGRLPGTRPGELDRYMSNEIRLELPSDVSVIEHVVKLLADRCREYRSYGQKTLVNLRIAVSEGLSNAILSGNQGDRSKRVRVWARVNAWAVKVQVTDEGPGFDPQEIPDPTASGALEASGGRGVFLLKRLADDLTFNETGNALTFTLRSDWEGPKVEKPEDSLSESEAAQPLVNVLERLRKSSGADLHLWTENLDGALEHIAPGGPDPQEAIGKLHWLQTPGIRYAIEVRGDGQDERWADFARDLLDESVAYEVQLKESRRDLAERQEEIELLHSITETLGAVTELEDAASQILKGVVRVTGADRASLWIYDSQTDELALAASEGPARVTVGRVSVSSSWSVSALAFRENRTVRLDETRDLPDELGERLGAKPDPWVSVPVSYTSPTGASRTVGVLNLIGRSSGAVVSHAGETRLLMTLARQIGSAIENLKLFEEILARERVIGELELAHDLQMKLLPDLGEFAEVADVAARCVPARAVGGDFYQLFKLADGKIGAMLGDVTSHGFSASLIMALSMSVTGIYAREAVSPGDLLRAIHRALIQKLESTEMFMTVFYGVIDPVRERLAYANAGHAHAFRLHRDKRPERLLATSPPLGIAEIGSYGEALIPWEPGDMLCLFTDGLTNPALRTTEATVMQAVVKYRESSAEEIVEAMFEARGRHGGEAPDDQTAFVLRA
jgi:sigma-B regulation protein RsbU (phosphoserine phosphatase)